MYILCAFKMPDSCIWDSSNGMRAPESHIEAGPKFLSAILSDDDPVEPSCISPIADPAWNPSLNALFTSKEGLASNAACEAIRQV